MGFVVCLQVLLVVLVLVLLLLVVVMGLEVGLCWLLTDLRLLHVVVLLLLLLVALQLPRVVSLPHRAELASAY